MAAKQIASLTKERESVKLSITLLETHLADHAATPLVEIKIDHYLKTVASHIDKLDENFHKLIALVDAAEYDATSKEYDDLLQRSLELQHQFTLIKKAFTPAGGGGAVGGTGVKSDVRLPRLNLPTFNGKIEDWVPFRDIFTAAIHNNAQLSNVQKLTYLKGQLEGEAARQVQSITISDINYDVAWKQLSDRYQNDRHLLFSILKRLTQQPFIQVTTASALRQLVDVSKECMRSLEVLAQPVKQWDAILLFTIYQKLDVNSKQLYEQGLTDSKIPKLQTLFDFMEQRSRALEASSGKSTSFHVKFQDKPNHAKVHHAQSNSSSTCPACNGGNHPLFKCSKFHSMSVSERYNIVRRAYLCFNCLRHGHSSPECPSGGVCRTCNSNHHSLLHNSQKDDQPKTKGKEGSESVSTKPSLVHNAHTQSIQVAQEPTQTLLATANVIIKDFKGKQQEVRVFLDSGADTNLISEKCVKKLGLHWRKEHCSVTGLSHTPLGTSRGVLDIDFSPYFDPSLVITARGTRIMSQVTCKLPVYPCNPNRNVLRHLTLADPDWHTPKDVDMLIGAGIFYSLLGQAKKVGKQGDPIAQSSDLGWLVVGEIGNVKESDNANKFGMCHMLQSEVQTPSIVSIQDVDLDRTLRQFWEIESVSPASPTLTLEEKACESHFLTHTNQNPDGRFVVKLPFKKSPPDLGPSRDMALQRLQWLERRLARNPDYRKQYNEFMQEYLSMGHMEEIPSDQVSNPSSTYIPHHFVLKDSSSTTKFRVVFDASAKTGNGLSLNDSLMVGPTIQDSLFDIMLRFRLHAVAFTADIAKMYRQIRIHPSDTDYQRILWRESPSDPIKDFRLTTVTYGTGPAPFLATRSVYQLAINSSPQTVSNEIPSNYHAIGIMGSNSTDSCKSNAKASMSLKPLMLASRIALRDLYVDDLMSGSDTVEEAIKVQEELIELFKRGGMQLRKWTSSHKAVIDNLPADLRETSSLLPMEVSQTVKTLGIFWQPESDNFLFRISPDPQLSKKNKLTKRSILSDIARIFDPIGWLAPVVITAKIMMQSLWKLNIGWDEPVPIDIQESWTSYKLELHTLETLKIPRCIKPFISCKLSLIGFCDASQVAYSAIVYLGVYPDDLSPPLISLVASKTRVAPTKTLSLPRLELCGAVLLAELMESVEKAHQLNFHHKSAWTDSTVTLAWIQSSPNRWKTYVANRVTEIQNRVPSTFWGHVAGVENPADCASRGIDPSSLPTFDLWWNGPSWLKKGIPEPVKPNYENQDINHIYMEERREKVCNTVTVHTFLPLLNNFSSLLKLQRVTAFVLRFVSNCRYRKSTGESPTLPSENKSGEETRVGLLVPGERGLATGRLVSSTNTLKDGPLQPQELQSAMQVWIKLVQQQHFHKDIEKLADPAKPGLNRKSSILSLNPFLDEEGVLRVGGRIRHSPLPYQKKHPILLPRHSKLTELIIIQEHIQNFHAGPQLLLSSIQSKYWIIRGRDAVRHQIRKCVLCSKLKASTLTQLMGDLPAFRITPARAFSKCGVDYAGPFLLRPFSIRSKITTKAYMAIFVCCVTRAIHLELVTALTTEAFVAALRRFIARRGRPTDIYSDCGTNFVGANREMKEMISFYNNDSNNQEISDQMSKDGIHWHFNPPASPHFGGLWESGVKSVKYHLTRVVGSTRLNYEELSTIFTQIEAALNSRPLTPESNDPNDFSCLTPGHFLIGAPLTAAPDADLSNLKATRLSRWQLLQQMFQGFWKRWSSEYVTRLQQRPKWMSLQKQIKIGDLVIIKDERLPPLSWRMGRVIKLHPGEDGIIRVVTLKTQSGELKRPITKMCLLPVETDCSDSVSTSDCI